MKLNTFIRYLAGLFICFILISPHASGKSTTILIPPYTQLSVDTSMWHVPFILPCMYDAKYEKVRYYHFTKKKQLEICLTYSYHTDFVDSETHLKEVQWLPNVDAPLELKEVYDNFLISYCESKQLYTASLFVADGAYVVFVLYLTEEKMKTGVKELRSWIDRFSLTSPEKIDAAVGYPLHVENPNAIADRIAYYEDRFNRWKTIDNLYVPGYDLSTCSFNIQGVFVLSDGPANYEMSFAFTFSEYYREKRKYVGHQCKLYEACNMVFIHEHYRESILYKAEYITPYYNGGRSPHSWIQSHAMAEIERLTGDSSIFNIRVEKGHVQGIDNEYNRVYDSDRKLALKINYYKGYADIFKFNLRSPDWTWSKTSIPITRLEMLEDESISAVDGTKYDFNRYNIGNKHTMCFLYQKNDIILPYEPNRFWGAIRQPPLLYCYNADEIGLAVSNWTPPEWTIELLCIIGPPATESHTNETFDFTNNPCDGCRGYYDAASEEMGVYKDGILFQYYITRKYYHQALSGNFGDKNDIQSRLRDKMLSAPDCSSYQRAYYSSIHFTDYNQDGEEEAWQVWIHNGTIKTVYGQHPNSTTWSDSEMLPFIEKDEEVKMLLKHSVMKKDLWFSHAYSYDELTEINNRSERKPEPQNFDSDHIEYKNMIVEDVPMFHYVPAQYPGGAGMLRLEMQKMIVYPEFEKKNKLEGTVRVGFTIGRGGHITGVHVIKGVSDAPGLGKEALRVVNALKKFIPAVVDGEPVIAYGMSVLVEFELK
jgi:TonB family protein